MEEDRYTTLASEGSATLRERGSRFLALASPAASGSAIALQLDAVRRRYPDATHRCFAWRLGLKGDVERSSDDGEPSGTAGRPILGQLHAEGLTDALVVVVRWFGGTKLGVPGLIAAYRTAAARAIEAAGKVERTVERRFTLAFPYRAVGEVMRVLKAADARIDARRTEHRTELDVAVRASAAAALFARLGAIPEAEIAMAEPSNPR